MPYLQTTPLLNNMSYLNTQTPGQEALLTQGSGLLNQLLGLQGGDNPFMPLTPQGTADWYNQRMRPIQESAFRQNVMPRVQEAYVGPGTYWSGARAAAQSRAEQDFENQQQQNIGNMYMQNRTLANQALLPFAAQLLGANTGLVYGQQKQDSGGFGGLGDLLNKLMQKKLQAQQPQIQPQMAQPDLLSGMGGLFEEVPYQFGPQPEMGPLFASPYEAQPLGIAGPGGLFDFEGMEGNSLSGMLGQNLFDVPLPTASSYTPFEERLDTWNFPYQEPLF